MFKFLNFFIRRQSHNKKRMEKNSVRESKTSLGLRNKEAQEVKEEKHLFI